MEGFAVEEGEAGRKSFALLEGETCPRSGRRVIGLGASESEGGQFN